MTSTEFASVFPPINATLNGLTAIFLAIGFRSIKQGRVEQHRRAMLTALATSAVFLTCYLVYHAMHGVTSFPRHDWSRPLYFTVLTTHTFLAVANLPLIYVAVRRAMLGDFEGHKRITRWLWPSWMYVSITGVLVYFMLYQWFTA